MGIRKSILPIGLAAILVFVMATAPMILSAPSAFAQISITPGKNVLSIEDKSPFIHKINPNTGDTISSVEITLDGSFPGGLTVNGGTGIAHNPADGKIYALLKLSDDPGDFGGLDRHLATIDPQTGIATLVGDTGVSKIASLTFNPGTLYSVDLGNEYLSTISTADGSVTNLCELDFFDGTGLTFNPNDGIDGLLYYTTDDVFQRIDDTSMDPCDVTDIALSSDPNNPRALAFFNSFLMIEFQDNLFSIANNGDVSLINNDMDHGPRGLTIIDVDAIGGEIIPLDSTMVLAAGAQYTAAWMIPVLVSAIGIGIVIARKF